jgi:hypothetical protein
MEGTCACFILGLFIAECLMLPFYCEHLHFRDVVMAIFRHEYQIMFEHFWLKFDPLAQQM